MSFRSDCQLVSLIKNRDNEVAKSLIKKESLQNAVDKSRNTLLHYATEYGNPEIVQYLIDLGSEVDAQNDYKQTALMRSFESDIPCKQVIEILLRAGANSRLEDSAGKSALITINDIEWLTQDIRRVEILKVFLEQSDDMDDFYDVLCEGNEEVIKSLLGTGINLLKAYFYGKTLVHQLAMNCNPGVIEQLHGKNFDVNVRDDSGWTPLVYASAFGAVHAVQFLLDEGADIEAKDDDKQTALYIAILNDTATDDYECISETVRVLLDRGANVQIENVRGKTIFDLVLEYQDFEVPAELVLAHLALQEARGIAITDVIRNKVNADRRLLSYFKESQDELSIKVYPSITLFDILAASDRKVECYLRNKGLALKLFDLQVEIDYFETILRKRIGNASRMIELRKIAAQIICKLMNLDYESYPFVIDDIVSYLDKEDIEGLILIKNKML